MKEHLKKEYPVALNPGSGSFDLYHCGYIHKMNHLYTYYLYEQRLYPLNPSMDEELNRLLGWSPGRIHYSITRNEFSRNGTRDSEFVDENNRDIHGAPGSRVSPNSDKNNTPMATSTPDLSPHQLSFSDSASPQHSPRAQGGPPQQLRSSIFPSALRRPPRTKQHCSFCKNNGERDLVFMSHNLKTDDGVIICPVLRNYVCPICHATGDIAHTLKYCPNRKQ